MRMADLIRENIAGVPHAWTSITGNWDTHSLIALAKAVQEQGVDPKDTEAVRTVWNDLLASHRARYTELQQEASRDAAEYQERAAARNREIETLKRLPGVRTKQ